MELQSSFDAYRMPDAMWENIRPLLTDYETCLLGGRPRRDLRSVADAIFYRLRTGCQWKAIPKNLAPGGTAHAYFQEWVQLGIFARLWQIVLELYDDLVGLDWRWQNVDGVLHYIRLLRTTLRDALTRSRGIHCGVKEHLCMDKGYDSVAAKNMVENVFDYIPDLRSRGEEKKVNATANNVLDVG